MTRKTLYELDLIRIAGWHRRTTILTLVLLFSWITTIFVAVGVGGANPSAGESIIVTAAWLVYLGGTITAVVFVIMLLIASDTGLFSIILHALLTLVIPILVLASVVSSAGKILRLAGARPGFVGVPRSEVEKLRPAHCKGCGYDRRGIELLAPCPECTRVPMVI